MMRDVGFFFFFDVCSFWAQVVLRLRVPQQVALTKVHVAPPDAKHNILMMKLLVQVILE